MSTPGQFHDPNIIAEVERSFGIRFYRVTGYHSRTGQIGRRVGLMMNHGTNDRELLFPDGGVEMLPVAYLEETEKPEAPNV